LLEHARKASAAFARGDDRHVDWRKGALRRHGLGKQRPGAHTLAHVLQNRAQAGGRGAFGKQVQSFQNGQTGADQRVELLVEDQKVVGAQFAPAASAGKPREQIELVAHREDVISAIGQPLPRFVFRLRGLDLLKDAAGGVSDFAHEIGHGS